MEFRKHVLETRKGQAVHLPCAPSAVDNGEICVTLRFFCPDPIPLRIYQVYHSGNVVSPDGTLIGQVVSVIHTYAIL